jgi:rhodanese-related sulfurtransferase
MIHRPRAKQPLYEQFARVGKALASPSRLELLDLMAQGERSVEALAALAHQSVANTSQHLRALHAARLVETRREGHRILYRLASDDVGALWLALRSTAEKQLLEVDRAAHEYLEGKENFPPIARTELLRRLRDRTVTLIDVRPREEFEAAHIAGAISVPLEHIDAWARRAPRRKRIVAYCRGPYCVYALMACARLAKRGLRAMRAEDGVLEWRAAGLPLALARPRSRRGSHCDLAEGRPSASRGTADRPIQPKSRDPRTTLTQGTAA